MCVDVTLSSHSDFGGELDENRFNKMLYRLNLNLLTLCFAQGVDARDLLPQQTLRNIRTLISSPQLGL